MKNGQVQDIGPTETMNVKQKLMEMNQIKNIVCRENGNLEVYSQGDVKSKVFVFLNKYSLNNCFVKVEFYDTSNWNNQKHKEKNNND